ncbi:MAG: DegT/DnrJ/EryC1/StrS family aminotransferase [Methanomicrobiales archaeon]|nr:DegT/DnrJ/EryC1/StrS family aminotransferase [Methanomicrobiales archaeon]MDI6876838.1 DegT/DnrJ/EryC1/StrS family aminotransferase [Methanomicrobiales archaeon]
MQIPIARPALGQEEAEGVLQVLQSGMLVQGKLVAEFEQRFADYCGTRGAVATNSGTAALHAALHAAGIGPGDEVLVPSFTFFATASSVSMCGATPVFVDVDRSTFNIDPASLAEHVTPRTKAVVGVHLFGQPFDLAAVQEICEDRALLLVEDAAQAHGATYGGRKVGSFGIAGCFSFYATKNMITGEGGMVTADDPAFLERVRLFINHGQSQKYLHTTLGYNLRMTDLEAAIGLVQLQKLEGFNERRRHNADYYDRHIRTRGLSLPFCMPGVRHVYHQYVVRVEESCPLARDALSQYLNGRGVGNAVHYPIPLHMQPLYRSPSSNGLCPVAERLAAQVLSLPVHPGVTDEQLDYVCSVLNEVG